MKTRESKQEKIYEEEFELVLPTSLAGYKNCQVIRIRNSHLETAGISKGALALVADEEVKRGDIAALRELSDDSIICGFYDYFAGIVSLLREGKEDILYKSEEVEILGKIVGVGTKNAMHGNKIYVKPIDY